MATAREVIEVAWNEVGYVEQGTNRTKYGKEYGMDGQYWCAIFQWWVFKHAGASKLFCNGQKTAFTPTVYYYYKGGGRTSRTPKVGDLILLRRDDVPSQVVGHIGLVFSVTDKYVYSIEGNSSNKVRTVRRYRTDSHIVTYAHPRYSSEPANNKTGSAASAVNKGNAQSLKPLGDALGANTSTNKYSMAVNSSAQTAKAIGKATESLGEFDAIDDVTIDPYATLYTVVPEGDGKAYYYLSSIDQSIVEGQIELSEERRGQPSKLTFNVLKDSSYKLKLGAPVGYLWGGEKMFFGFIFEIKESDENKYEVTCYDQMRYLKNKHSYVYKKKSATSVLKIIAKDFRLSVSSKCADTKYAIPKRIETDQTLFDIILTALDLTLIQTGKMYQLYDDFGSLNLRLIDNAKVDTLICLNTVGKYESSQSIDNDVYNKVRVTVKGSNGKKDKVYIQQSGELMNKWGVLQYTETQDTASAAKSRAKDLLAYYKQPKKTLKVDEALGSTKIRAGVLVPVLMKASKTNVSNYLLVERCTHTFSEGKHTMSLDLVGGGFDV